MLVRTISRNLASPVLFCSPDVRFAVIIALHTMQHQPEYQVTIRFDQVTPPAFYSALCLELWSEIFSEGAAKDFSQVPP